MLNRIQFVCFFCVLLQNKTTFPNVFNKVTFLIEQTPLYFDMNKFLLGFRTKFLMPCMIVSSSFPIHSIFCIARAATQEQDAKSTTTAACTHSFSSMHAFWNRGNNCSPFGYTVCRFLVSMCGCIIFLQSNSNTITKAWNGTRNALNVVAKLNYRHRPILFIVVLFLCVETSRIKGRRKSKHEALYSPFRLVSIETEYLNWLYCRTLCCK